MAFIGPADLSASLGHMGDPKHPEVQAAMATIEAAAKRAGVALASICRNWEEARDLYQRGYQMVTLCSDANLLAQTGGALVNTYRDEIGGEPLCRE